MEKRPLHFIFILLILSSLACQFGQQAERNNETEVNNGKGVVATAVAELSSFSDEETDSENEVGRSRTSPLPPHTIIQEGQWTIEILETNRGESAWQAVHLVNSNNQLPPEGWEYLNVKLRIHNDESSDEVSTLTFAVTGDGRVKHYTFNSGTVPPEPQIPSLLPGKIESEGWETILIHENENNLMFVFEDLENYSDLPLYLALDEGASVTVDQAMLENITRTEFGVTQDQPVPFGQVATGEDWQIIVLDVLKGDAAWDKIVEENQFNDPPESGMEYIMVRLRARYIGFDEHGDYISDTPFTIRTNSGTEFEAPSLVDPKPTLADTVYPGGEVDGWIVLNAPEKTKNLMVFFSPDASGANDRYLSLGQGR